jgi:hypothetical protein
MEIIVQSSIPAYGMGHTKKKRTEFWWENLKEGECLLNLSIDGRIKLK